jgi:hypothetical protein
VIFDDDLQVFSTMDRVDRAPHHTMRLHTGTAGSTIVESVPAAYSRRQEAKTSAHQCDSARSGVVSSRGVGEQFGFGVVERV